MADPVEEVPPPEKRSQVADWLQIMSQAQASFLALIFGITLCVAFIAPLFFTLEERLVTTGEFVGIAGSILAVRQMVQRSSDVRKDPAPPGGPTA